jgi:hypothetical protein
MFQSQRILLWAISLGTAVVLGGCGSPASQEKPKPANEQKVEQKSAGQGEHADHHEHEGHDQHPPHEEHK